ncbi:MAG: hypothetical protein V4598_19785 [Bdellovibrionota bacterium]
MKGLLVHGCYDQSTFQTLTTLGVENFAFDLRGKSTNLVTFKNLKEILSVSPFQTHVLIFEDDTRETILSFFDLLKNTGKSFVPEFRDNKDAAFYSSFGKPYLWYFRPEGEWEKILKSDFCEGIILPLKYQSLYQDLPHLWTLIEEREIPIWLHAENFVEAEFFENKKSIQPSLDLTAEIQISYRSVDQTRLSTMKLWRKLNESSAGQ